MRVIPRRAFRMVQSLDLYAFGCHAAGIFGPRTDQQSLDGCDLRIGSGSTATPGRSEQRSAH